MMRLITLSPCRVTTPAKHLCKALMFECASNYITFEAMKIGPFNRTPSDM